MSYRTPRTDDNAEDVVDGGQEEDEEMGNLTGIRLTLHGLRRGPANGLLWRFARVIQTAIEDEGFVDNAPMPGQQSETITVTMEFQGGSVDRVDWLSKTEDLPVVDRFQGGFADHLDGSSMHEEGPLNMSGNHF